MWKRLRTNLRQSKAVLYPILMAYVIGLWDGWEAGSKHSAGRLLVWIVCFAIGLLVGMYYFGGDD